MWRAAYAINQQDRNPLRVIRLSEIDSETVIAKKVERPPYSASSDVSGKAFVVERDHLSKCKVQFTAEFFVFFRDGYGSTCRQSMTRLKLSLSILGCTLGSLKDSGLMSLI